jgi:hypothetical protein
MRRNVSRSRLTESNSFEPCGLDWNLINNMRIEGLLAAAFLVCVSTVVLAEPVPGVTTSSASAALPDAPLPQTQAPPGASTAAKTESTPTPTNEGVQTKRILGIIPNFRSVSANQKLPPETVKEKFKTAALESFDYSAVTFAAGQAAVAQAQDSYPEFHQGAAGYGRYFWHTFADQTDENLWVQGIFPVALHQDSRYYTLGHGGFIKRGAYSFSRVLITRTDDGNRAPNYSEVVGAGVASSISAAYYPSVYQTWTKIGQRWLTNVIIDGVTFGVKEFWPDVNNAVFHQKD